MRIYCVKGNVIAVVCLCVLLGIILCSSLVLNFNPEAKPVSGFHKIPICSVQKQEKQIAFTFNCISLNNNFVPVIELLDEYDIKATFFVTGEQGLKNKDLIFQIYNKGHDIGNLTYSYQKLSNMRTNKVKSEIEKCNNVIQSITGKRSNLFRAPYDDYGKKVVKVAESMGMYSIRYDIDSLVWKKELKKDVLIKRIVNNAKPGSVIVFQSDGLYLNDILNEVITDLKINGYDIVPVSRLIKKDNFEIDKRGRQINVEN